MNDVDEVDFCLTPPQSRWPFPSVKMHAETNLNFTPQENCFSFELAREWRPRDPRLRMERADFSLLWDLLLLQLLWDFSLLPLRRDIASPSSVSPPPLLGGSLLLLWCRIPLFPAAHPALERRRLLAAEGGGAAALPSSAKCSCCWLSESLGTTLLKKRSRLSRRRSSAVLARGMALRGQDRRIKHSG